MEYLNNLILSIKQINDNIELKNMDIIVQPYIELIKNILRLNSEIKYKINIFISHCLRTYKSNHAC